MGLGIANAAPATATNEIAWRYVGRPDSWQRRCNPGCHHRRKRRLSL